MDLLLLILIFILAVVLIVKGGKFVVEVGALLGDYTGINEALIGATLTSLATTFPELILTILGMSQNTTSLVVGNSFGTILVNICLVLGASLSFLSLKRINKSTLSKIIFVTILTALMVLLLSFNILNVYSGILLIVVFFSYFVSTFLDMKKDLIRKGKINKEKVLENKDISLNQKLSYILKFVVGTLIIFAGAQLLVNAVKEISFKLNISQTLIGLIAVSISTSLPELVTSVTSIRKKRINLAIGNVVGANIINLTLLLGLAGIFSGASGINLTNIEKSVLLPSILIASIIFALPVYLKKRTYKWQGITLLSLYTIYCIIIILTI